MLFSFFSRPISAFLLRRLSVVYVNDVILNVTFGVLIVVVAAHPKVKLMFELTDADDDRIVTTPKKLYHSNRRQVAK